MFLQIFVQSCTHESLQSMVVTGGYFYSALVVEERNAMLYGWKANSVAVNEQELVATFGGYISLSITTPPDQCERVLQMLKGISPSAKLIDTLNGTQAFEVQTGEETVDDLFCKMEQEIACMEKDNLDVLDWGVSSANLEDVFIKVVQTKGL